MIWSCLPVSLFPQIIGGKMQVGEWAVAARDMGMDAIDLSILFIPHRTITAVEGIKKQLRDVGMPVAMITTYPDFTQPDPLMRERELAHAVSDIAIAAELGAKYLRITAGQAHPRLSDDEGVRLASEGIARCCPYAQRWGSSFAGKPFQAKRLGATRF